MNEIIAKKPLFRWNNDNIKAGEVGSVGDVIVDLQLKHTRPGDIRWQINTSKRKGSAVGTHGRVTDSFWNGNRSFKTSYGWESKHIELPDMKIEPIMGPLPQYTWRNKIPRVQQRQFSVPKEGLVLPPEGGLTRGGNFPIITDVVPSNYDPFFGGTFPKTNLRPKFKRNNDQNFIRSRIR